jgi:hypothetical protein
LIILIPTLIVGLFGINNLLNSFNLNFNDFGELIFRIEQTEYARSDINDNSMELFLQQPLVNLIFGSGQGYAQSSMDKSTHNGFIAVLIDNGILYLTFMVSLIILTFRKLYVKNTVYGANSLSFFLISLLLFLILREQTNNQGMLSSGISHFIFLFILTQNFIKRNENFIFTQ